MVGMSQERQKKKINTQKGLKSTTNQGTIIAQHTQYVLI